VVAAGAGKTVELRGDEALCVFDSPRQALRAAVALQQRLAEAIREDPSLPLRVGIGLEAGEAVRADDGYRGGALNLAARLCSLARAGEVLAGDGIVLMAGQVDGLTYSDRGRVRVKGIASPVRVHKLEFELDLPSDKRSRTRLSRGAVIAAVAAAVALAGAGIAAFVALGGSGEATGVAGDSAALLDAESGRVESETAVGATPLEVVSDASAAWTLDADSQTISRVSPDGGRALTKASGVTPTSLALGGDLVWVAQVRNDESGRRVGVAALDPSTLTPRRQRLLPGVRAQYDEAPTIEYAGGAVWISGPDDFLRKLSPFSLEVIDSVRLPGPALDLASGLGAIWATVGGNTVLRIDPHSLHAEKVVTLSTPEAGPIAVGASSLWVTDALAGHVWRIAPGPRPETHTISAGNGAVGITFGDGAAWVANPIGGRVVRIDAETEEIREFELGNAPVDVSVSPQGVWAAVVAGGGRSIAPAPKLEGLEALPAGTCAAPVYGGSDPPDLLVVVDLPMQQLDAQVTLPMVQAIEFVLRTHEFRAGAFDIALQACDDATVPAASYTTDKCVTNAKRYVATPSVVAMIGPYNSGCADVQIPIANRARPGPLPIVSPTASLIALTRVGSGAAGNLERLYPTGIRNFARVYPADDVQGAADAILARQVGVRRPHVVVTDPGESYAADLADAFANAGRRLGLQVATAVLPVSPARYGPFAERLRRERADAVFIAGLADERTDAFVRTIREKLGRRFVLIAPDSFLPPSEAREAIGPAASGMYVSGGLVPEPDKQLPPEGVRFTKAFSATQRGRNVNLLAPYAAQAAEVLLAAIARSDGTRASVARELFRVRLKNSIFGPFSLDANGDPNTNLIPIFRVPAKAPPGQFPVEHVDRVISVPARLVR